MNNTGLVFYLTIISILSVYSQRSPYAGSRPTGYKDRFNSNQMNSTTTTINQNELNNRFGENHSVKPTNQPQRLPHDAYGDTALVNFLYQQPEAQRPYWLINQQAIEAHRNTSSQKGPASSGQVAQTGPLTNRFSETATRRPEIDIGNIKLPVVQPEPLEASELILISNNRNEDSLAQNPPTNQLNQLNSITSNQGSTSNDFNIQASAVGITSSSTTATVVGNQINNRFEGSLKPVPTRGSFFGGK